MNILKLLILSSILFSSFNAKADVCAPICAKIKGSECVNGDLPTFLNIEAGKPCLQVLLNLNKPPMNLKLDVDKIISCANQFPNESMKGEAPGFMSCLKKHHDHNHHEEHECDHEHHK